MKHRLARMTISAALSACIFLLGTHIQSSNASLHESASPAVEHESQAQPPEALRTQAEKWLAELGRQPQLANWSDAQLQLAPLGPGTHGWIATITHSGKNIGYMIINALPDGGYQLGEFGTGEYPIFNDFILEQSISRLELSKAPTSHERLYSHPLLATWRIEVDNEHYYTDAMTGELLPVDDKEWMLVTEEEQHLQGGFSSIEDMEAVVAVSLFLPAFDPYAKLPWLSKKPVNISNEAALIKKMTSEKPLRYAAERFHGQMLNAWAAVGFIQWKKDKESNLYIAIAANEYDEQVRFIPFELLNALGAFYD